MTRRGERLVIVGGGMAAGRLLGRLSEQDSGLRVTLISEETAQPYNRVLLPDLLAGACSEAELALHPSGWYDAQTICVRAGRTVVEIDRTRRHVHLSDGREVPYDLLVLATGASVPLPDAPGVALAPPLHVFRSLDDRDALQGAAVHGASIAVVGGGLLGLETARSLAARGVHVTVIHRSAHLMNRQLDLHAAGLVQRFLESVGIDVVLEDSVAAVATGTSGAGVRLVSGRCLDVSAVVFATGSRPNDELARRAGLRTDNGVLVSSTLQTSDPCILAIGECARVDGESYAMVEPVFRQADVVAERLGGANARFAPPAPATRLKVAGLDVYSAGVVSACPGPDDIVIEDPARNLYRRLCFERGRLTGAVLVGDSTGSRAIQRCLEAGGHGGRPLDLAFGIAGAAA